MKLAHFLECTNCFNRVNVVEHNDDDIHPGETTKHVIRLSNCEVCGHNQFNLLTIARKQTSKKGKDEVKDDERDNDNQKGQNQTAKGN